MYSTHRMSSWEMQERAKFNDSMRFGSESQALTAPNGRELVPVPQYETPSKIQMGGLDERSIQPSRTSKNPSWAPESFQPPKTEAKSSG